MNNIIPSIEKAKTAINLMGGIEVLTGEDRRYISSLVEEIRIYQDEIGKMQERYNAQEYCSECEGTCCFITVEHEIDVIDYFVLLFNRAEEYRRMIIDMLSDYTFPECHFKKEEGCILPDNSRPFICKSFFCEMNEALSRIFEEQYKPELQKKMTRLEKVIQEMGFNLYSNRQIM